MPGGLVPERRNYRVRRVVMLRHLGLDFFLKGVLDDPLGDRVVTVLEFLKRDILPPLKPIVYCDESELEHLAKIKEEVGFLLGPRRVEVADLIPVELIGVAINFYCRSYLGERIRVYRVVFLVQFRQGGRDVRVERFGVFLVKFQRRIRRNLRLIPGPGDLSPVLEDQPVGPRRVPEWAESPYIGRWLIARLRCVGARCLQKYLYKPHRCCK
ncbi:hypothetical protein, putative [Babesia ovata]|uniref:Uncharacterized protein n=1 Tax=Babesia ovata TaxID=189622 RepID=A0A2H6KB31_9APIC|nr:hypothetical protein, putative [Babesia ovata]GBE60198.1 hypothetical protein, putative [Babesia ovata]